jgi:SNF2 family DNA or RNA helicase
MIELFEHQKTGIEFLERTGKAILADEMGLGKTRQAIVAAKSAGGGTLIVCPASLKINWQREIKMVYPDDEVHVINRHDEGISDREKWIIINYDILQREMQAIENLIENGWVENLILDEAHYIKGKTLRAACIVGGSFKPKTKKLTSEEIEQIAMGGELKPARTKYDGIAHKMKRIYCLTGTPLLNRPIELYNLLRAIGHPLGNIRTYFAKRYCGAFLKVIPTRTKGVIRYMDETGATNLGELREAIKGSMIRRKKEEVLNLPQRIVSTLDCELDKVWQKNYDTAWDLYIDFLQKNPIPERNIDNIMMARHLVEITKLKQVCSQAKMERIMKDVENAIEQDEKVIIFSQYTNTINGLAAGLMKAGIRCRTLTGADDMDQRQSSVDDFQKNPGTKVFIANIKAGGVGLNLTAASIVIFADMDWSPEIHNQAIDRAHRIGQDKMVNAYFYVCSDTIEEDIVDILNSKKNVLSKILEGSDDSIKSASTQVEFLHRMSRKAGVDKV